MSVKPLIAVLAVVFLLVSGFRPGALPFTPGARFSDAATSHYPAALFLRHSVLEQGVFPLWCETILAGQPFAADPLNKTAYPLQWLALIFPPALHLDLMILLHLLIAGFGMWRWARSLDLRLEAAALSTLAYVLAPRVIGHTGAGHLDLLYALAWFPCLMWAVGEVIHYSGDIVGAGFKPAPTENTTDAVGARYIVPLRPQLWVGLFGGLILLADVRLSLFAFALAGAYALYEAVRLKRARALLRFILPAALIVLLTLSVTVPLLAWRPYLSRAALTPQDAGIFSLEPVHFLGLLLPPRGGNIETLTYLGLSVLVLALMGAIAARRWFWIAAIGIAALYALGINTPFWRSLVQFVPAMLWFRVPSRAWFVVALIAPLLAGYGVQWLMEERRPRPPRSTLIALIGTAAALVSGLFLWFSVPAVNGLAIMAGGGGIGLCCLRAFTGRLRAEPLALALILITFLDLALVGRTWIEWRTSESWLPPDQVALAERLTELGADRIYSPTYSLQQQVAEEYHLRLFGGVDPFQLSGLAEAIKRGGGIESDAYSVILPPLVGVEGDDLETANRGAVPDTAILGQWGVTHVVSVYPLNVPNLEQVDVIDGVHVYANRDPALVVNSGWAANWQDLPDPSTIETINRMTVGAVMISGIGLIGLLALTKVRR